MMMERKLASGTQVINRTDGWGTPPPSLFAPNAPQSSGTGQNVQAPRTDGTVWPPPPQTSGPTYPTSYKIPAIPEATSQYFLAAFIRYGAMFGAAYGGVFGFFFFIIGAAFGAPIGGLIGTVMGFFDGLILGAMTKHLVIRGNPLPVVCAWVRRIAPLSTLVLGGTFLLADTFLNGQSYVLDTYGFYIIVYAIAVFATWHAACVATKKFMAEYE